MTRILFLDACLRGPEHSRTYRLCRHFLDEYSACHPETKLIHRDLRKDPLPLLTGELAAQRESWEPDHPLFIPAHEVADADLILVGAPYWDLSFPAALKVYLEWASCLSITFRYTQEGALVGMSRAKHLVYCTTAGGPVTGQNYGYEYLRALGTMFGIPNCHCVAAEGLDVRGNNVDTILARAKADLTNLVKQL